MGESAGGQPDTVETAPVETAPVAVSPAPAGETDAERTERLNREADRRAGLAPGQSLPAWDLAPMAATGPTKAPKSCVVGARGALVVEAPSALGPGGALSDLEAGPAGLTLTAGRHQGARALQLATLVGPGDGPVTVRSCSGGSMEIAADQLSPDDRWLLVLNNRGSLKLIDRSQGERADKAVARDVTALGR